MNECIKCGKPARPYSDHCTPCLRTLPPEPAKTPEQRAYDQGWQACENFIETAILNADPGFHRWLDQMEAKAKAQREAVTADFDALNEQQNQMAQQAIDDLNY